MKKILSSILAILTGCLWAGGSPPTAPLVFGPNGKSLLLQNQLCLLSDPTNCFALGSTNPGGSPGAVQYNNAGAFGGFGNFDGAIFTVPDTVINGQTLTPLTVNGLDDVDYAATLLSISNIGDANSAVWSLVAESGGHSTYGQPNAFSIYNSYSNIYPLVAFNNGSITIGGINNSAGAALDISDANSMTGYDIGNFTTGDWNVSSIGHLAATNTIITSNDFNTVPMRIVVPSEGDQTTNVWQIDGGNPSNPDVWIDNANNLNVNGINTGSLYLDGVNVIGSDGTSVVLSPETTYTFHANGNNGYFNAPYFVGDGSMLYNLPNTYNQSLNTGDNVQFNRVQVGAGGIYLPGGGGVDLSSGSGSIDMGNNPLIFGSAEIQGDGNGGLYVYDGGDNVMWQIGDDNNTQAWFGATPVSQQSGDVLSALSNYGLVTSPDITFTNPIHADSAQTTYSGSVSGQAVWSMPFDGTSYKKFVINLQALNDAGGTITYPVAFTNQPYLYGDAAAIAVSSTNTTTFTLAVTAGVTGNVFIEGE